MTTLRRGAAALWLSTAAALLLGACTPVESPDPTPEPTLTEATATSTTPSTSTSPEPSPSPSSTLSADQAAAVETVLEFFRLKNELSKDPTLGTEPLIDITTGETQELELHYLALDREEGLLQTGDTRYGILGVGDLVTREGVRVVEIGVCTDSTAKDVVDRTGVSVLPSDRAYFVVWQVEVLYQETRWKIGDITSGKVDVCNV